VISPRELVVTPPPPGQRRLERRVGRFDDFVHDAVLRIERQRDAHGAPLAHSWDVAGDPAAAGLVRLWAFVADGVAAYAELTAGEGFLRTAADWTDLRRIAALVGYRPRPRIAAQGWVRAEIERGTNPVLPAGTRVQAPPTATRQARTFEATGDTQLRSEWEGLTATWPLTAATPKAKTIRFGRYVEFDVGDTVLFVSETAPTPVPLLTARVAERLDEIGTSRVTFDRDVARALKGYPKVSAYRVVAKSGAARRLRSVITVEGKTASSISLASLYRGQAHAVTRQYVVLDALLDELAAGREVALAQWHAKRLVHATVKAHAPVEWAVAPGTTVDASRVELAYTTAASAVNSLITLAQKGADGALTFYVLEGGVSAKHHVLGTAPTSPGRLRLFPGPAIVPSHLALETTQGWELVGCAAAAQQETSQRAPGDPLIVDLDREPAGNMLQARASGNVFKVRHGTSAAPVAFDGDVSRSGQLVALPDAPIAHDLDETSTPSSSLIVRVDGMRWDERPSLYRAGNARAYRSILQADGGEIIEFGAQQGARPSTGRGNITAAYRIGGGTEGEVEAGAIDSLLGSVRGVQKVLGAGPTSGGADQDDEGRICTLAPSRARAFGRVVSLDDAVDLALAFPGVSHVAGWVGAGRPGCACGGRGPHVAFARTGIDGPRTATNDEVVALRTYLDARRDLSVGLCVVAAEVTVPALEVTLAVDPARVPATVLAAARAQLAAEGTAVSPERRQLGEPLDPSDIYSVLHAVPGVLGVLSTKLGGIAVDHLERHPAKRYELLLLDRTPLLQAGPA
jgi:hypothetical protein